MGVSAGVLMRGPAEGRGGGDWREIGMLKTRIFHNVFVGILARRIPWR